MILPTKHIDLGRSLLGQGATVLEAMSTPQTVSRLWERVRNQSGAPTFERFVLILDLLFALNAIDLVEGLLHRVQK